jgi:hypothetical protein
MPLEFRETKRRHGRKKIREIDVHRVSPNFELKVGIIRPDSDEFEPTSFERFTRDEMKSIFEKMEPDA